MGGDKPERIVSINLSSAKFWWSFFIVVTALVTSGWSGYSWVDSISRERVTEIIKEELHQSSLEEIERRHKLDKRIMRIEFAVTKIAEQKGITIPDVIEEEDD